MRRASIVPVAAGFLVLLAACTNPFAPSSSTGSQAIALAPEVKSAVEQFVAKYNAHDAIGAGELFLEDPGFHWVEDGRTLYDTRTAAISGLTNFLAGFNASRLEAVEVKIAMQTEDSATATFRFTQTIAANGQASLRVDGVITFSLANRDGWKIIAVHKSSEAFPR